MGFRIDNDAGLFPFRISASLYFEDLISWSAIGARMGENQIHREMASGLSCPVGMKNAARGDIGVAVDVVMAATTRHSVV